MRRKTSERRPERRHGRTALAERPERPARRERPHARSPGARVGRGAQARAEKRATRELGCARREERRQRRSSQAQPVALGALERDGWGLAHAPGPVRALPAPGLLGIEEERRYGPFELGCLALAFLIPAALSVIAALAIHATLPTGPGPTPARRPAPVVTTTPTPLAEVTTPAASDPSPADDLDVWP